MSRSKATTLLAAPDANLFVDRRVSLLSTAERLNKLHSDTSHRAEVAEWQTR